MARTVSLNGTNYSVPEPGDKNYDQALTDYLVALATAFVGTAGTAVTPTGTVNGVNATFTLPAIPKGTLMLFVDRVLQVPGTDYTLSSATITFLSGAIPQLGAILRAYF